MTRVLHFRHYTPPDRGKSQLEKGGSASMPEDDIETAVDYMLTQVK